VPYDVPIPQHTLDCLLNPPFFWPHFASLETAQSRNFFWPET
jgi:hypothetical protein